MNSNHYFIAMLICLNAVALVWTSLMVPWYIFRFLRDAMNQVKPEVGDFDFMDEGVVEAIHVPFAMSSAECERKTAELMKKYNIGVGHEGS